MGYLQKIMYLSLTLKSILLRFISIKSLIMSKKIKTIILIGLAAASAIVSAATIEEIRPFDRDNGNTNSSYGEVVAFSEKALIVANDNYYDRSVYIYVDSNGDGRYGDEPATKLKAFDFVSNSNVIAQGYANKIAASGNTLVVGAGSDALDNSYVYKPESPRLSGAVYVYVDRDNDGDFSDETAEKIKAPTPAEKGYFGRSVAISGNTLVVGDNYGFHIYVDSDRDGYFDDEIAQTFVDNRGVNNLWTYLAISGNKIAVGFYGYNYINGAVTSYITDDRVSLYIDRNNNGLFDEPVQHLGNNQHQHSAYDSFGKSLAISGNTIVIGSYGSDELGTDTGAAYIYVDSNDDGIFNEVPQKLNALNPRASDNFGRTVAIKGNTLLITNYQDDEDHYNGGTIYLYRDSNGNGLFTDETPQYITNAQLIDSSDYDYFGHSLAIKGDIIATGATNAHHPDDIRGSVYTFSLQFNLKEF